MLASIIAHGYLDAAYAYSIMSGGTLMLINFLGLAFFWKLIFIKKSVVLAIFGLTAKYIFLVAALWGLSQMPWLKPVGFIVGFASLPIAGLAQVFFKKLLN